MSETYDVADEVDSYYEVDNKEERARILSTVCLHHHIGIAVGVKSISSYLVFTSVF